MAQNKTITGKVTDEKDGTPIAGVSVTVTGATGTVTTADGTFRIVVPGSAKTIEFSYVGFATQRLNIAAAMTVALKREDANLDEVVVVAYGTAKKETLTGSVGQIKSADYAKRPISNVTAAIEGAIPGVVTSTANGQPGSGISIRVRGFGSINATSEPLFVVDGVPYVGGTSNINPDDVESTTILKDAAATALYGSRAANGVVMITTKKGRKGRNNISVRGLQGVVTRGLPEYERVDAFQYYPLLWESYRNSLVYPASGAAISIDSASRVASGLTTRTSIHGLLSYNPFNVPNNAIVDVNGQLNPSARLIYGDDLDWTRDLMRDGVRKDYSVNFSGGADKSDYFFSMGYLKETGYTIRSDFERFTARLNMNVQPLPWLKTGLNISGNYSSSVVSG
jgi:TonB-linked SusC/RagA family outer membrane protein